MIIFWWFAFWFLLACIRQWTLLFQKHLCVRFYGRWEFCPFTKCHSCCQCGAQFEWVFQHIPSSWWKEHFPTWDWKWCTWEDKVHCLQIQERWLSPVSQPFFSRQMVHKNKLIKVFIIHVYKVRMAHLPIWSMYHTYVCFSKKLIISYQNSYKNMIRWSKHTFWSTINLIICTVISNVVLSLFIIVCSIITYCSNERTRLKLLFLDVQCKYRWNWTTNRNADHLMKELWISCLQGQAEKLRKLFRKTSGLQGLLIRAYKKVLVTPVRDWGFCLRFTI